METIEDTKVLVFSLLRSFIVTPFDLAIFNRKQRKKEKMPPKKIIKLDPKLFGLLGQQKQTDMDSQGLSVWDCRWFVCVEVLRPSQPNGVMSSAVSLPNHMFTGQA